VGLSWLAALVALPGGLLIAVIGQGLGAVLGGCHWIGISTPVDHQVWAVVNQPTINFASMPAATGYWMGSLLLPVVATVALLALRPRQPSMVHHLAVIQGSWCLLVVTVSWLPLVDLEDGHVSRWLALHDMTGVGVVAAPALGVVLGLWPTTRLLALARRRRPTLSRRYRVGLTTAHFVPPAIAWLLVSWRVAGELPLEASGGMAVTVMAAVGWSSLRFPAPAVRPVSRPTALQVAGLAAAAAIAITVVATGGRPMGSERAALLWAPPQATNNIRSWMAPEILGNPGTERGRAPGGSEVSQHAP
jgi:hypothetical protein